MCVLYLGRLEQTSRVIICMRVSVTNAITSNDVLVPFSLLSNISKNIITFDFSQITDMLWRALLRASYKAFSRAWKQRDSCRYRDTNETPWLLVAARTLLVSLTSLYKAFVTATKTEPANSGYIAFVASYKLTKKDRNFNNVKRTDIFWRDFKLSDGLRAQTIDSCRERNG